MYREAFNIFIIIGLAFIICIVGWMLSSSLIYFFLVLLCIICFSITLVFFRNPSRKISQMKNILVAPSDGRIVEIRQMQYCPHIQDQGYHIAIYLSLWDVHVIRFPLKGKVISVKHQKGQFHPAFLSKASENNEYVLIDIDSQFGKTYLKLIAGTVARRIVCRLNVGDQIESGNPFGIIKFGSRVELFLPLHINLQVREGDRVRAGEDIIGVFNRGF